MAKTKDKEEMTVEALVSLTSPLGEEQIRTFDRAWHRSKELPLPVHSKFLGFVRKN